MSKYCPHVEEREATVTYCMVITIDVIYITVITYST
jgi:hypothetical protein